MFKVGDLVECVAEFSNNYDSGMDTDREPDTVYLVTEVGGEGWIRLNGTQWCWRTITEDGSPRFKLFDEIHKED